MQQNDQSAKLALNARLGDVEIDDDTPFKEDLLKRKPYAEILTKVLSIYTHGAVIALNGKWGTGKTTFVKKWQKMLEKETPKFNTIYFNAWQADYLDDPLVPLIANLQNVRKIDSNDNSKFENLMKAGAKIAIAGAVGFGKAVIKRIGGELVLETLSSVADECGNLFKKKVDEFSTQTKSMEQFKTELTEYVNWIGSENALVYFIDELDRCNPTYAVRVLERVKHLFEIPGIVFILSIDKDQLENSIKGYFGSGIDAEEYLRRFIDISYNLPQPELEDFCRELYRYYNLTSFFHNEKRKNSFRDEGESLLSMAEYLCPFKRITLRQLDRIFALTAISLREFQPDEYLFPELFFFLTYLKVCYPDLFDDISNIRLSIQELINEIENLIPTKMLSDINGASGRVSQFDMTIAKLLVTYSNDEQSGELDVFVNDPIRNTLNISKLNKNNLINSISHFNSQLGRNCPITHLTNKINLLDGFMD
jgi:ABC-type iron transport system FetAB ATPase subunit